LDSCISISRRLSRVKAEAKFDYRIISGLKRKEILMAKFIKKQKLYEVNAEYIEYLPTQTIKATSKADAEEKWGELWNEGKILVFNSETKFKIKEIK
jgi:hypothetical protein